MIKSLKRAFALVLTLIFALSLVPTASFAANKIPGANDAVGTMPFTGQNVPESSLVYAGESNIVNGYWSSIRDNLEYASEMAYSDGTFGKLYEDMVYLVRDNTIEPRTVSDLGQAGYGYVLPMVQDSASPDYRTRDFAVEYSFAMTDTTDVIQVLTQQYTNYAKAVEGKATSGIKVNLSTTAVVFNGTSVTLKQPLDLNKWYNACVVYDMEADSTGAAKQDGYVYKLFINNELYATHTATTKYYGPRYVRLGTSSLGNSNAATPDNWVHYDNLNAYIIDDAATFTPDKPTASTLTSTDANIKFIEDTIDAPANYTVKNLKDALAASKPDDVIRFYNSDYSALASDIDPARGTKVVIASLKDGVETTFAYYTVDRWIFTYNDLNKGGTLLPIGGKDSTATWYSQTTETNSLGGKKADDVYIRYADSSGNPYMNIDLSAAGGERDVFEFSVCVPEGAAGVSVAANMFKNDTTEHVGVPMYITSEHIRINFGSTKTVIKSWEPGTWHTVAFETPESNSNGSEDNNLRIYVDGALMRSQSATTTSKGFRHIRFSSEIESMDQPSAYFDNIRVYSGTYEPKYDLKPSIESPVYPMDAENVISVIGYVTVGELKNTLVLDEDTSVRFYADDTYSAELSDSAYVTTGTKIVAATKNGTDVERAYEYYEVFKPNYSVDSSTFINGSSGTLYDTDDTLSASIGFINNTDNITYNVKMYAAQYRYGELINLWTDEAEVAPNSNDTLTCDFAGMTNRENSSVKIMILDDATLSPFDKATQMRWGSADTEATLFLVGDSIVQTYENPGYPIQGWGYYIGNFLNENITVDNRARSGWTTDHYLYPTGIYTRTDGVEEYGTELRRKDNADGTPGALKVVDKKYEHYFWSSILPEIQPGDYLMISLGINDSGSGNVRKERYLENIETMYREATAKGATVIFTTPTISGRAWDSTGAFSEGWGEYGRICMSFANKNNSVCLPLGATLVKEYNKMVADYKAANPEATDVEAKNYVRGYFHMYEPIVQKPKEDGGFGYPDFTGDDSTHHNYIASEKVAGIISQLLKESGSSLGDYVITE